jgi:hypothetical protein
MNSIGDLLKQSWQIYKANFKLLVGIVTLPIAISFITVLFSFVSSAVALLFILLGYIIGGIVGFITPVALIYALKEKDQNIASSEALKKSFRRFFSWWRISFLAGIIVIAGLLMLIIPGIILSVWFGLASYVMVMEDRRGMAALLRSKDLISGYSWGVLGRVLVMGIVALSVYLPVAVLSLGLGLLFGLSFDQLIFDDAVEPLEAVLSLPGVVAQWLIAIFVSIYGYLMYQNLRDIKKDVPYVEPTTKRKLKYLAMGILGIVVIIVGLIAGIVLVSLGSARDAVGDARLQAQMNQLRAAVEIHSGTFGAYPITLDELEGGLIDPDDTARFDYYLIEDTGGYKICAEFKNKGYSCIQNI